MTEGGVSVSHQRLRLLNLHGDVLVTHTFSEPHERYIVASGERGYLISENLSQASDVELLDAVDLNSVGRFELDGLPGVGRLHRPGLWRLLEDGSIYGAKTVSPGAESFLQLPRFGRFGVPGSPVWDAIFRDGSDQGD